MKVLLHICCGVCAAGVAQTLIEEGHQVAGFYYNPNIHPLAEYQKRLAAVHQVASNLNFPLEVTPYLPDGWLQQTESLKDEPEGGKRCEICFRIRLEETYRFFQKSDAAYFTTTLTVSPRKSANAVNQTGLAIGGEKFLARDFKKKDGFKKAIQLAKSWQLYRQDYCGCVYSINRAAPSAGT